MPVSVKSKLDNEQEMENSDHLIYLLLLCGRFALLVTVKYKRSADFGVIHCLPAPTINRCQNAQF